MSYEVSCFRFQRTNICENSWCNVIYFLLRFYSIISASSTLAIYISSSNHVPRLFNHFLHLLNYFLHRLNSSLHLLNHSLYLIDHFLHRLTHFLRFYSHFPHLLNHFSRLLNHFPHTPNHFLCLLNHFIHLHYHFLHLLNHFQHRLKYFTHHSHFIKSVSMSSQFSCSRSHTNHCSGPFINITRCCSYWPRALDNSPHTTDHINRFRHFSISEYILSMIASLYSSHFTYFQ